MNENEGTDADDQGLDDNNSQALASMSTHQSTTGGGGGGGGVTSQRSGASVQSGASFSTHQTGVTGGASTEGGIGKTKMLYSKGTKAMSDDARRKQADRVHMMLDEARGHYIALDGPMSIRGVDMDILIADLLRVMGSFENSKKHYEKALNTLRVRGDGTDHIRTGNLLAGLSSVVFQLKDTDYGFVSVRLQAESVSAYASMLPEDHPVVMTARGR